MDIRGLPQRQRFQATLFLGALLVLVVSACGPVHADPIWASVSTIDNGTRIIIAFADRLTMIDPTDGRPIELRNDEGEVRLDEEGNPRIWDVRIEDEQTRFYSAPLQFNTDTLLVASYDRRLIEIDKPVARDGRPIPVDGNIVANPVSDGERIYVGLTEGDLVAFSLDEDDDLDINEPETWRFETEFGVWAAPLVVNGVVYFTAMDHSIYAVDAESGELIWQRDLGGAITGTPVMYAGSLYISSFASVIWQLNPQDGAVINEYATDTWVWSSPTIVESDGCSGEATAPDDCEVTLFAADMGGTVYALDVRNDMEEIWKTQVSEQSIRPAPLVAGEYVVVGSRDQNVYWLDRDRGGVVDAKEVAGEVISDLLLIEPSETVDVDEPLVVVSTTANQELLVAFTLERGQRLWAYGR